MPVSTSENLLGRFFLDQTELLGDTLEVWRHLQDKPLSDDRLAPFVDLGLRMYKRLESLYEEGYARAVKDQALTVAAAQRERRVLEAAFRIGAEWSWRFWEVVRDLTAIAGRPVEGTDRLLEAARRFKELQARLAEEWPACSPEEEQEALAQVRRGEGLELDDAFAQIAGVDKATWLQRVAAHEQKQRPRADQE
jgi:hypothetical protein